MSESTSTSFSASSSPVTIRPLREEDVPQIVPLLAENYKTQTFRVEFFKHVMRQPAPTFGLLLFGFVAFFSWGNLFLALLSPVLVYVYLAALYHFQVNNILSNVPDLKDMMAYYMSSPGNHFWVAVCEDEVAGSVGVRTIEQGVVEIKRMQVSTKFRQRGIARRLLDTAMTYSKEQLLPRRIVLSTTAMQVPAQKMYQKYGFHYTHTEKRNVGPLKLATMDLLHFAMDLN